jgi:NAD(P)H-dependent FMN reductase
MTKIKIILGTTRPERFGEQPANWMLNLAKEHGGAEFELIDLREVNLPLFDEPVPPAMGAEPVGDHTKEWANIIGEADGFIIVTGEYDHTIPAALTNAVQFLAKEWANKPVAYVGYGAAAGGARAIEHLRQMAGQLSQFDISEHVLIPNYWSQMSEAGVWTPSEHQVSDAGATLDKIVFWTDAFADARAKLAK